MTATRDRALPHSVTSAVGWRVAVALLVVMLQGGIVNAEAAGPAILTLTPSQGTPAQVIQADGRGFCTDPAPACGTVSISFAGFGDIVRNILVDPSGNFSTHFQPPAGPPGSRTVTATQNGANGKEAVTTFTITLQPSGVTPPPQSVPIPTKSPTAAPAPTTTPLVGGSPSPSPSTAEPAANADSGPTAGAIASGQAISWQQGLGLLLLLVLAALALGVLAWRLARRGRTTGPPASQSD
jgi:hypothetical protein